MSPSYDDSVTFVYPSVVARFMPLSTNLASEQLQIDTDLLLIITSTAADLSGVTNTQDVQRSGTPKTKGIYRDFTLRRTFKDCILSEITGDRPRQPAYEIKLMLSYVS